MSSVNINKLMYTFQEFLQEAPQWQKSLFDIIMTDYIAELSAAPPGIVAVPLQTSLFQKHFDIQQQRAVHLAGLDKVDDLVSISNKKSKHVSASTKVNKRLLTKGLWGGGGAAYILEGDLLLFGGTDVWSVPTKQGTRVTALYHILKETEQSVKNRYFEGLWKIVNSIIGPIWKKLPNVDEEVKLSASQSIKERTEELAIYFQRIDNGHVGTTQDQRLIQKIKHQIITKWFDWWNAEFAANTDYWKSVLFNRGKTNDSAVYNEVVLSNFDIKEIVVYGPNKETGRVNDIKNKHPNLKVTISDNDKEMYSTVQSKVGSSS